MLSATRNGLLQTRVAISLYTTDTAAAEKALNAAFAEIERVEATLSELKPGSQVSTLNQSAGKGPVKLSAEALALLARGKEIGKLAGGAFALTAAALAPLWDFSSAASVKRQLPDPVKIKERLGYVDDARLTLSIADSTAELPVSMSVSTRGLIEGYALSRALAVLRENGFKDALVAIGGDIAVTGNKGGKPWLVGIQDPRAGGYFASFPIADEAVATAGDYYEYFELDGSRYANVLDPRSGTPARGCRSVTVVGPDPLTADALATTVMVLGPEAGLRLVEATPDYNAVIVDAGNEVIISKGIKSRLRLLRAPTP